MNLQQRVEDGEAAYIHSLVHDADSRTLRISFMRADTWAVYGTLTFGDVEGYRFEFDTDDDEKEFAEGLLIEV